MTEEAKESAEQSFQESFDEVAEEMGLELEAVEETWPPWGFVMISPQAHWKGKEPDKDEVEAEIREVIRHYEGLNPTLDDQALDELAELTTDPFFCVGDTTTLVLRHADLEEQRDAWQEALRKSSYRGTGESVEIDYASFWHLGPSLVQVSYLSREEKVKGEILSTVILRSEEGRWKLNVVSHYYSK